MTDISSKISESFLNNFPEIFHSPQKVNDYLQKHSKNIDGDLNIIFDLTKKGLPLVKAEFQGVSDSPFCCNINRVLGYTYDRVKV